MRKPTPGTAETMTTENPIAAGGEPEQPPGDARAPDAAVPSVFDLLGASIAAAHQSSAATVAQLNVALMAYRALQVQRDSLGEHGALLEELLSGAKNGRAALDRILRGGGAQTGENAGIPRTFGTGRKPEPDDEPTRAAHAQGE
jgi:hypothetical protein